MNLLIIALAPVLIIALYIYIRDKHEREPFGMLLLALLAGCFITIPIVFVEGWLAAPLNLMQGYSATAWNAFIVAALTEESFKFAALFILFWRNKEFNEKFDGIVYACFISLGFASVENVLYVLEGGMNVGYMRAFTAVPAHALFGVIMGYHFGLARFYRTQKAMRLFLALAAPILLHGIYDFMLMTEHPFLLFVFLPYLVFLWIFGFRKIRDLSNRSIFKWITGNH